MSALPDPVALASAEQRKATSPAQSAWVEANAGTGKTKVLTDRVTRLLLNEVKPERLYHLRSKELYASERADGPRLRPNPNAQGSNAYYYCIRKKASRGKK